MENIKPILQASLPENFIGVGTVTSVKNDSPYCMVQLMHNSSPLELVAIKALDLTNTPIKGDRILCAGSSDQTVYITMILERDKQEGKASAKVIYQDDTEVLTVYNKRNELIFEYDTDKDRSRVIVDASNLDLNVPDGDIKLSAGGQIKLESRSISMTATETSGAQNSRFNLGQFSADLQSPILNIKSDQAKFNLAETFFTGTKLLSNINKAKISWGRLETLADTLVQKFRTHFTEVEELSQVNAGRIRTLVRGAFRLKAQRVKVKSDKNVDIDGERINLG